MKNGKPRLVSVVVFAIRSGGRMLLLGPDENGAWGFPSEEFDEALNGSLDDTVRRSLRRILTGAGAEAECVGSFVAKRGNTIETVYNFSVAVPNDAVHGQHMWIAPSELGRMELDLRTAAFLKSFGPGAARTEHGKRDAAGL